MLRQAFGRLAVSAAPRQVVTSFCRPLSTTTSEPRKTKAQLRREEYLKEVLSGKELTLATGELRPKIAENAEQLLKEAEEAIPPAAGYRGAKRKKQQRLRWAIIRESHAERKAERIQKHERVMAKRKGEAARDRMRKIGVPLPPEKEAAAADSS